MAQCEVCQAFDKVPRDPAAGTSTVAMFNEKSQVDLLFLDDIIALRILDVFSKYSLLIPVRTKNPQEVWDASRRPRIWVFGHPVSIQLGEGSEWENELSAELRSDRRIKLLSQGVGAHPWILGRRSGLSRGIFYRLKGGDRFSSKQIPAEA